MADNFGLKIGVEGEKEFKNALRDINQSFKVLGSEMKLVSSEFDKQDKSVAAVAARNEVLNKAIDAQKDKITTLEAALKNAADSFGENDRRTQNWAVQLNNAKAELNGMEKELDETADSADDLGDELEESGEAAEKSGGKFEKLGGVLKGIGAAMGAVALAAGAAAVKLGKEVIAAYADYEQLVGGVDTLFKDSSQTVQNYAANAFKTAGMSANEYMETVTGFSASLIQSLGGDTAKAAQVADMAITDMADNANKMGTDISSIQTAYQGFAKQNYTMLDNLKLGYGGTKSEMERLLADAEKISGIKYDLSSFSDLTEAIHVIQTEMGITGTTAKEATETISGSMSGMQSAISNLMAGNQKWRIRSGFENGELLNWRFLLGYHISKDGITVDEDTAPIVREIFARVIAGESFGSISRDLNDRGFTCALGGKWCAQRIRETVSNEKYTGNAMLQKRYRNNHLEKKLLRNTGELPMFYAESTHPAIIDKDTFDAAQVVLRQKSETTKNRPRPQKSEFTGKIHCPFCGKSYKRNTSNGSVGWNCSTYLSHGKAVCHGKKIPETTLKAMCAEVLGTGDYSAAVFAETIERIEVPEDNHLRFIFKDGSPVERTWADRSRRESWTPAMRQAAAERTRQRRKMQCQEQ